MTDTTRVARVMAMLATSYPYRVSARDVRRVCALLPVPRRTMRRQMEGFIARVVALPFALDGATDSNAGASVFAVDPSRSSPQAVAAPALTPSVASPGDVNGE